MEEGGDTDGGEVGGKVSGEVLGELLGCRSTALKLEDVWLAFFWSLQKTQGQTRTDGQESQGYQCKLVPSFRWWWSQQKSYGAYAGRQRQSNVDKVGVARAILGHCPVEIVRSLRKTIQYNEIAYQNELRRSKEKSR